MTATRFLLPWAWPSAALGVHLVERLDVTFDPAVLRSELADVERAFGATVQTGPHHNGKWNRLGLIGPGGDHERSYAASGEEVAETPVLALMPTVRRWLAGFDGLVQRAILSRMEPGCTVRWHRDPQESADRSTIRLHLPVVTNPQCIMEIGHEQVRLSPGLLWYSDFTFPHRVFNRSAETRTHVMIDLAVGERTLALMPARVRREAGRRRLARAMAARVFDASEKLHAEGRYAEEFRRERQRALANGQAYSPQAVGMKRAQGRG